MATATLDRNPLYLPSPEEIAAETASLRSKRPDSQQTEQLADDRTERKREYHRVAAQRRRNRLSPPVALIPLQRAESVAVPNSERFYISGNLRRVMANRKLCTDAVVDATGVAYQNVQRIANGKQCPTLAMVRKLAKGLGVDIRELIGFTPLVDMAPEDIANVAIVGASELLDAVALPLDTSGLTMRIEDYNSRWALGGIDPELFDVSEPVEATQPKRKRETVRLLEPFKSKTAAAARYRSGL